MRAGASAARPVLTRRWTGRPGVERFDLYTRAPLYAISASEPVVLLLLVNGQEQVRTAGVVVLVAVSVAHTAACLGVLQAGLRHAVDGTDLGTRLVGAALVLTAIGLAVGPVALPVYDRHLGSDGFPVGMAVVVVFCGAVTAAVTPALRGRPLLVVLVAPALVLAVLEVLLSSTAWGAGPVAMRQPPWALNYAGFVGALVLVYRSSAWVLGIVWEIDRARDVQARLAVAEERLRVARDLHDVLGRNLTLIAVNSELATQLAPRDTDAAVARMRQVRQTAQEAMRDVRDVVTGQRHADLDAELAGARSVLRSAGIATRVIGDGAGLPAGVQAGLGWAVREATTNILRHAEPTTVTIDLSTVPDGPDRWFAQLRIDNDGVPGGARPRPLGGHGHGLAGLRDRLARLDGDLTVTAAPAGHFAVQARLPLRSPVPAADQEPTP